MAGWGRPAYLFVWHVKGTLHKWRTGAFYVSPHPRELHTLVRRGSRQPLAPTPNHLENLWSLSPVLVLMNSWDTEGKKVISFILWFLVYDVLPSVLRILNLLPALHGRLKERKGNCRRDLQFIRTYRATVHLIPMTCHGFISCRTLRTL